ncbi:MAG: hypothetical protein HY708_04305 [Ignavibacteriae bacterium]|nr:hypothetical protein [Ignavibacteriota bacterium]
MKKKKTAAAKNEEIVASCNYCGATVGEISERTEERVHAVYDCPKCKVNYCDQCSYFSEEGRVQRCLRCESKLEKVT